MFPDTLAHEAYPGHHTEHVLKEQRLNREQGRGEHSILLINAPECTVSEGIATWAREMILSDEELRELGLVNELAPRADLADEDMRTMLKVKDAKWGLRDVTGNAALFLHEDGADEKSVVQYILRYGLSTPEEARKSLQFISHPTFRSYSYTYTEGWRLLDRLFELGDPRLWVFVLAPGAHNTRGD